MAKIEKFEDLKVWQIARDICNDTWHLIETTPIAKDYELKNQMSRSSGSIMDNIAEGFERNGTREFIQFLCISKGSCGELRSQLYRALDRKHISNEQFFNLSQKTETENQKLGAFISYLNKSGFKGPKFTKTSQEASISQDTEPGTQNP
jgi:four helix bundle protein